MPQLNQLALVAYSQFFWLLLVLGLIYFGIGKAMLPKIQSTVEARESRIAGDIAAADRARTEADATEEAYRAKMDESRGEAMKLAVKAKSEGALATEQRVAEADASIQAKAAEAEARIKASRTAAVGEIEALAAGFAKDIADKVAGLSVSEADAAKAVKAVMVDG
ncbi:MAG: ATPase [Sphingomonas sp.]|uniref:F0F1 ATP synthase subunit B family protein n=1 Tax=Sphingomonas sp. TaxID=28214 RepID=UPI001839B087|nr:ATPase [Sphingomonas sp.]MBA3667181.1 ATPase [Sphingomonas sp.]